MIEKCFLCGGQIKKEHQDCKYLVKELWEYIDKYGLGLVDVIDSRIAIFEYCNDFVCTHCDKWDNEEFTCFQMDCIKKMVERLKQYKLVKIKDEWQELER